MKRFVSFVFASVFFCLTVFLHSLSAQTPTPTPTPPVDEILAFQRTDTPDRDLILRGVSNNGNRFVFESNGNLTGNNTDLNQEIFLYEVDSRSLLQITNTKDIPNDPNDATKGIKLRVSSHTPLISGDGSRIVFVSNSPDIAGANDDGNFEIFLATVPVGTSTVTFQRITNTTGQLEVFENYTPTISNNGSVIAFVSIHNLQSTNTGTIIKEPTTGGGTRDVTVNNADGTAEIYLYNVTGGAFFQVTSRVDADALSGGVAPVGFNSAPYLSGDGNVLAFVSSFNYPQTNPPSGAPTNTDFNGEIFVYRAGNQANQLTQVTATTSADTVFTGLTINLLTLSSRHLNNTGSLLAFESSGDFAGKNSDKSREVYVYKTTEPDRTKAFVQVTDQRLPASPTTDDLNKLDLNFLPGINNAGTIVTIGSIRILSELTTLTVEGNADNADGSREVLRINITDLTSPKIRQMTFTPASGRFLDQRENTPVSWSDDTGTLITYHTAGDVIGVNSDRTFEIFQALVRPVTSINAVSAVLINAASYAPAPAEPAGSLPTIARSATAAIFGTNLANAIAITPSADLPFELAGVTVTVKGVPARLIFVSPGQINLQFPPGIAAADSVDFNINNNGVLSSGKVKVANVAPAIFVTTTTGKGPAVAGCLAVVTTTQNEMTMVKAVESAPPCEVSADDTPRYLIIFGTGWRNAASGSISVQVQDGTNTPVTITTNYVGLQPGFRFAGLDQINALLPKDLPKGTLKLTVTDTSAAASQTDVTIEIK